MDSREGLYKGYVLNDRDKESYIVENEVGRGASCIVYNGSYTDSLGFVHYVRLKECYPVSINIQRQQCGMLNTEDKLKFECEKNKFIKAYKENVAIRCMQGFTNSSSNVTKILECNNTLYTVIDYQEGTTYDKIVETNFPQLIKTILSIAKLIKKYHDHGYLYLDLKPSNILILPESREQIVLFDFDSLWNFKEENNNRKVSFSRGFSAPEQCRGYITKIGKHSDIYAVGALLFYKLFDRIPNVGDTLISTMYDYSKIKRIDIDKYSSLLQEYLTLFFHNTLSTSIYARWTDMESVIKVLEKIYQITTISITMKNFIVDYTTKKPCFRVELIENRLDSLSCESEWQYMKMMNEIVSREVSVLLKPKSEIILDYREQYNIIFEEIKQFFSELINEDHSKQEILKIVDDNKESFLKYIDHNIDLQEVDLIKIQVQQQKPRKQIYLDLKKKDTIWTTLFGKEETRYCLSLESRTDIEKQIERILNYNEQMIHKAYVDNIKKLFDQINGKIEDKSQLQQVSSESSIYTKAMRMIYSSNEKLYRRGLLLLFENYKIGNTDESLREIKKQLPISEGIMLGIVGESILFIQKREDLHTGGRILFKRKSLDGQETLIYNMTTICAIDNLNYVTLEHDPYLYVLFEDYNNLQLFCYDSDQDRFEQIELKTVPNIYGELFIELHSDQQIVWGKADYFDKSGKVEFSYTEGINSN